MGVVAVVAACANVVVAVAVAAVAVAVVAELVADTFGFGSKWAEWTVSWREPNWGT